MVPEILQHIERLQLELADVDPSGQTKGVAIAVAEIAAGLRGTPANTHRFGETPDERPK